VQVSQKNEKLHASSHLARADRLELDVAIQLLHPCQTTSATEGDNWQRGKTNGSAGGDAPGQRFTSTFPSASVIFSICVMSDEPSNRTLPVNLRKHKRKTLISREILGDVQLSQDAARAPHVDGGSVNFGVEQQLGRAIPGDMKVVSCGVCIAGEETHQRVMTSGVMG
jgi:hypothetical protein